MKFFMPAAKNAAQGEDAYQAVARFMRENMGELSAQRYYSIYYSHNGKSMKAVVGEPDPLTGELVCAIFRTARANGPFLICTPNRGIVRGDPILADGGPNTRAVHFEDYPTTSEP